MMMMTVLYAFVKVYYVICVLLVSTEVEYIVKVYTGTERFAGTDANVFICIYGEKGDTGERQLKDSSTNTNKFEEGQVTATLSS